MLPGFPRAVLGKQDPYAAAIAAITNKTIYARADLATGADNATLTTTNWDNEAVATPNISGSIRYKTGILNGFRGVLGDTSNTSGSTGRTVSQVLGGDRGYTLFAVEKRAGTQGADTAEQGLNSTVIGDLYYWGLSFFAADRAFKLWSYDTTYRNVYLNNYMGGNCAFTDNVPYVIAVRVDPSNGAIRANFNGTVFTPSGLGYLPSVLTGTVLVNARTSGGTNYGFEYIVSSDMLSNAVMDDAVAALKLKWGI